MNYRRSKLLAAVASASAGSAFAALLWARPAAGSAVFPPVVDRTLMLSESIEKVFPPDGCTLCHLSESGGLNSFRPFGALIHQSGAHAGDTASLQAALSAVEVNDPQFIKDLQSGHDPNQDTMTTGSSSPLPPTPEYGGSTGRSR